MKIQTQCPNCKAMCDADASTVGMLADCPACNFEYKITNAATRYVPNILQEQASTRTSRLWIVTLTSAMLLDLLAIVLISAKTQDASFSEQVLSDDATLLSPTEMFIFWALAAWCIPGVAVIFRYRTSLKRSRPYIVWTSIQSVYSGCRLVLGIPGIAFSVNAFLITLTSNGEKSLTPLGIMHMLMTICAFAGSICWGANALAKPKKQKTA